MGSFETPATHLLQKYRNSVVNAVIATEKVGINPFSVQKATKYFAAPEFSTGDPDQSLDLLRGHCYDVAALLADSIMTMLMSALTSLSHLMDRALSPFKIKIIISAVGFVATSRLEAGCTVASMSPTFTSFGRFICFGGSFVLGLLGTFGSLLSYQGYLNRASEGAGQLCFRNRPTSHRSTQATGVGNKRRSSAVEQPWYEQHLDYFAEIYAKTIEFDKKLQSHGDAHYDHSTGQVLTVWDVLMNHVYPVQHSFTKAYNSTIWYESQASGERQHAFTPFERAMPAFNVAGYRVGLSHRQNDGLQRRQCEESDTETTSGESTPEN